MIREYFLNYNEALSNDFTLSERGRKIELHGHDWDDWRITFVDTGLHSNIGQRLLRVRKYLEGEPMFLANYSDGLADIPLDRELAEFSRGDAIATFAAVSNSQSFHALRLGADGTGRADGRDFRSGPAHQRRVLRLPPARSSTTSRKATSSSISPSSG